MIINTNKKFIFLHLPKNAGSTLKTLFQGQAYGLEPKHHIKNGIHTHATADEAKNYFPFWDDYFKFIFVRNPWDRLYSIYSYWKNTYWRENRRLKSKNFKNWLMIEENYDWWNGKPTNQKLPHQKRPQMSWLCDKNSQIIVDYIGRVEDLHEDCKIICNKIGITYKQPTIKNKSSRGTYKNAYDNEMIEFVSHYHKVDIEYFGYKF